MIGGLPQSVPNPGQSQGSPAPVNLVPGNPHIIGPGDGSTLTYGYDALGRLTSEGQPFGSLTYAYDAAGDRTQITWADGFYVNYNYDIIGSVTSIQENGATSGVGVLATYTFDNLGRRTAVACGNGTGRSYAYDAVGRLAGLGLSFPNGGNNQLIGGIGGFGTPISYTPSSQIASLSRSNNSYVWTGVYNVSRTYTANGLNQYTAAGGTSFAYDARGNLSTSGTSTYSYSKLNELASVPAASANIYYDPLSRITEYDASSSTRFYYSGSTPVAEVANPSGVVTQRYVPGPGTDEPIVWYVGSGTSQRRFLQSDERGSINAVTDSSGNVLAINSYDEYGIPASSNVGRFGYTGQTWFPEVGLYNYKARWYSPTLGRFMQTDPIGYGDGLNWYNYAQGDPVNGKDPLGLQCFESSGDFDDDGYDSASMKNCLSSGNYWVDSGTLASLGYNQGDDLTYNTSTNSYSYNGNEFTYQVVVNGPSSSSSVGDLTFSGGTGTFLSVGAGGGSPQNRQGVSPCMQQFLASQGLGAPNLPNVTFQEGRGGSTIAQAAFAHGNPAVTVGNNVYVMPGQWGRFAPGTAGYFEETLHTIQWDQSGAANFGLAWILGSAMGFLATGDAHNSPLEAQAGGMSKDLAKAYAAGGSHCP